MNQQERAEEIKAIAPRINYTHVTEVVAQAIATRQAVFGSVYEMIAEHPGSGLDEMMFHLALRRQLGNFETAFCLLAGLAANKGLISLDAIEQLMVEKKLSSDIIWDSLATIRALSETIELQPGDPQSVIAAAKQG